ncbi:hypothetical protein ACFQ3R_05690 [Mesonia ostreae]|uniref:Uncharacterized protein n=1 Tax=Mesonia ostreae TaxID=861110 RepID=A0ABU2KJY4_9FLAO|nr:hypothetical protein [Mesonia ostreae]MDT0294983.1 hypothetical protein [Mesonia ostreae]
MIFIAILAVFLILAIAYRYSSKRIEFYGYYDKVWAHRANDLKKLENSQSRFKGIELDLVYQKEGDWLEVNHPPAPSTGLSFKEYVNHVSNKKLGMWLDLKNLTPTNQQAVFNRIEKGIASAEINPSQVIIESSQAELLNIFQKKGYRTSYYLPINLHQKTEEELAKSIQEIKAQLQKQKDLEISSDFTDYAVISKYFPKKKKNFWVMHSTYSVKILKSYKTLRKMLQDSSVQTVLTPYNNWN